MDQYKFYDPAPKKKSQWSGAKALAKLIKPRKESGSRERDAKEADRTKCAPDIPLPSPPPLLPPETPPPVPQRTVSDAQDGGLGNHVGAHSPALTPIIRGPTDRSRSVYRNGTAGGSSESINGEGQGHMIKALSSTPRHHSPSPSPVAASSPSSRLAGGRRTRGFLFDEDSCHNASEPMLGHHGNAGGRPGSADFSHNTSSSSSPVNCRDPSDRQLRSASLSSDDVTGLSQSQLALSRSATLPYDHAPQRAQPQRGGGPRPKTRPSSPGSEMVTLEQFLHESNIQSPPMVSTGSREDLMADYFTRSPAPTAAPTRDPAPPTSYVTPSVQSPGHRLGQSVKPSPRQPVGQSPTSAGQRPGQSLSRAFSLASADLLRSSGPDGFRGNEGGADGVVLRRPGGGAASGRERPLSARLSSSTSQQADGGGGFLNPPLHQSSSLTLQTERGRAPRNAPAAAAASSSPGYHHHHHRGGGEVAMVTPVRPVQATRADVDASEPGEPLRNGRGSADPSHAHKDAERARCGSAERPKSTPASPDPNNDPQTVWYEYGCV